MLDKKPGHRDLVKLVQALIHFDIVQLLTFAADHQRN
jgi:hypothetical protein